MKTFAPTLNRINGIALILPFLFSGLLACQEDTPSNLASTDDIPTSSEPITDTISSSTQTPPTTPPSSSLEGTVVAIEGNTYTIKNPAGENFTVEPSSSVLVDESLEGGDQADLDYSEAGQSIAVRKVRGEEASEATDSNSSTPERLIEGTLERIDQGKEIYYLTATTGENFKFQTDKKTLIDSSIGEGDLIAVSLSANQQPIAIRLIRPQK